MQQAKNAIVAQHPSIQANAMGVDVQGKFCILGTRRHLVVIDLDKPTEIVRRLNRSGPWDVSQVLWNPAPTKKEYFATTYSQTADLWTWHEGAASVLATLKGHTRIISDIDWCPCDDNLLATCSIDTYIYVWDIRDTKRPKMTPSAVAGANQVKWSKATPHILATAHDGDIRIWDIRKGRTPMQYITAHLSKIHCLDWSTVDQNVLASSGQDTTVRFWDTAQPSVQASYHISAGAPVWKARYTPFGHGMVTTLMPQMQRWDNSVLLWNVQNVSSIVHSYVGHRAVILDFGWRYKPKDSSAELVTWSKDHALILWKCDSSLLSACGCVDIQEDDLTEDVMYGDMNTSIVDQDIGLELSLDRSLQESISPSKAMDYGSLRKSDTQTPKSTSSSYRPQDILLSPSPQRLSSSPSYPSPLTKVTTPPGSLEREFRLMNIDLQNLYIDEADPQQRVCIATVTSNYAVVKLRVNFPPQYPNNAVPAFQFIKTMNISQNSIVTLMNLLRDVAQNHVRSNLACLEPCLRVLSSQVESISHSDILQDNYLGPFSSIMPQSGFSPYGSYQLLVNIPFPRTSGARFCGAGHLVTFMRPTQVKGFQASSEPTPRCLAALLTFQSSQFVQKQVSKTGLPVTVVHSNLAKFSSSPTTEKSDISVKSFYYKEKKSRKPWKHHQKDSGTSEPESTSDKLQMRLHKAAGKVVIQDLSQSLQLNRKLAESYIVPTKHNYHQACKRNADSAEACGRKDLIELWSTLEMLQSCVADDKPSLTSSLPPWASTSLGKGLVLSLIDHYSKLNDVQTLAMISCMFAPQFEVKPMEKPGFFSHHSWHALGSPVARSASCNSFENDSNSSSHKSNSFCENPGEAWWVKMGQSPPAYTNFIESPTDDYRYAESPISDVEFREQDFVERQKQLLDYSRLVQYDAFKDAYANILDRWKLMNQKTEILKYKSDPAPPHNGLLFVVVCQHCQYDTQLPQCSYCKKYALNCSLCQLPVKKVISFCFSCGHGGHPDHIELWFKSETKCPTGCGCECRPSKQTKQLDQIEDEVET